MEIIDYGKLTIEEKIERHLFAVKSDMAQYAALCQKLDNAYVPMERMSTGGWDLHPQNRKLGQSHISVPLVWFTVNTKSNILGMRPPTFNVIPVNKKTTQLREQGQFIESIIEKFAADENWEELHLNVCRNLSLYGRAVVQDGPDFTINVDQQYNVWISYRRLNEPEAMSFAELVSPVEAIQMGWDGKTVNEALRFDFPIYGGFPHDDPLGARAKNWGSSGVKTLIADRVPVLHFYSKNTKNGIVRYTLAINGQILKNEVAQNRQTWPFIAIEAEHVPGMTQGIGDAEPVMDLQTDISESLSAWSETVRRTIQDQWKAWGLKHLNPRIVQDGGRVWEMTDKDEEDIEPLKFIPNTVDVKEQLKELWMVHRKTSAIPEEAEANSLSRMSGYAMNVKFQALITSLAPRRIRLKRVYKQLATNKLLFTQRLHPAEKDLLDMTNFNIEIAYEEITPSDMQSEVTRLSQQVSMKLVSPYTAMEELDLNPEEEYALMKEFWTNPDLNPQGAMAAAQARMMNAQADGLQPQVSPATTAAAAGSQAISDKFPMFHAGTNASKPSSNVSTRVV